MSSLVNISSKLKTGDVVSTESNNNNHIEEKAISPNGLDSAVSSENKKPEFLWKWYAHNDYPVKPILFWSLEECKEKTISYILENICCDTDGYYSYKDAISTTLSLTEYIFEHKSSLQVIDWYRGEQEKDGCHAGDTYDQAYIKQGPKKGDREYEEYYASHPPIQLSSETDAVLPKNRDRTTIGVGEGVTVISDTAVEWEVDSELVDIIEQEPTYIKFSARDSAGSVTVKAKTACTDKSMTFTIIEPTSLDYKFVKYSHDCGEKDTGLIDLRVYARIEILPKEVNFGNVMIREKNCAAVDTGRFIESHEHYHIPPDRDNKIPEYGAEISFVSNSEEYNITPYSGEVDDLDYLDKIGASDPDVPDLPLKGGSMVLDIPIQWRLSCLLHYHDLPVKSHQVFSVDENGTLTTSKGSASYSINYKDPTVENKPINSK